MRIESQSKLSLDKNCAISNDVTDCDNLIIDYNHCDNNVDNISVLHVANDNNICDNKRSDFENRSKVKVKEKSQMKFKR